MRWSKLFIPTLREAPAGIVSAGERLLARAGYTRPQAAGDAAQLFLGRRSLRRIAALVRKEFDSLGAQEILVPIPTPMTALARELRSYKQLPQVWYQLQSGFEAGCFEPSAEGLAERYGVIERAIRSILRRCGVECLDAETCSGVKFVVPCESGGDGIARAGTYIAELASAVSVAKAQAVPDPEGALAPEPFHTPNRKTIAELADFTGLPETSHIKSLVMVADGGLVMALLRGDHPLSVTKLAQALGATELRPAHAGEIRTRFGAEAGSLGPVGVAGLRILADQALRGRRNMIAGANRDDFHLRHVTPGEDFEAEFFDLRQAAEGELAANGEPLRLERAVTIASCARHPAAADLRVTDDKGREVPLWMGSCRLALDRLLWAAAEQYHDQDGLTLPREITPFDLIVTPVDCSNEGQRRAAEGLAAAAEALGLDVLLDDRDERPGVKFKDADLTGIPWRVTIGKKLEQGIVEVVERRSKAKADVAVSEAAACINTRR